MLAGYLLVIILLSLVIWLRIKWGKLRLYWADRGVPFEGVHPFFGNLTFLQRENPVYWMRRVYKKFKAPYVGVWLFWRSALIINSPDLAKRILVKDADNFRNRYLNSGKSDPVGGLNIFTVNDPTWSSVRRWLTPVFTAAKLRNLEGLVKEKTNDLVERYMAEMEKSPEDINVRMINSDYTTDIIGEAAFGVQCKAAKTGDSIIRKVTKEFMAFSIYRSISWTSISFWPSLVDTFGFSLFPKHAVAFLRQIFRGVVEQRGGYDKPVKDPKDLLDALLKMKQDASAIKEEMSEDLLIAQAAIFLQGGFDVTAGTLTWAFKELAYSPHLQERLYQELVAAREALGKEFDAKSLAEVPYLNAFTLSPAETLRKFPGMGWLDRIAAKDYKLDDNLTIPAGTPLYVNGVGIQMDPDNYPDPETFNPDRFLPENEKNLKPYTFLSFGDGPRKCIGMRFAYFTLRYGLSSVVLNFKIRSPSGAAPPNEWPVERRGLLFAPDGKVNLYFISRK